MIRAGHAGPSDRLAAPFMPFDLQPIDILLLVVLLLAALSGWRRGFAMVVLGYAGLLLGLAVGAWAAARVGFVVSPTGSVRRTLIAVAVFFMVAAAFHAVGNLLGIRVRSALGGRWASRVDAAGGAVVACLVAAVALWFIALTLSTVPFSPFARAVTNSSVLQAIDRYAPRPPAALAQLRALLDRSPFPEAFANLRPPVATGRPPASVDTPAVEQAARRTVQIQSRGCGGLLFGSGFPVGPDLVVTNAHVVAGTTRHQVITLGGARAAATVVFFDPDRDLALLRVSDLGLTPFRLAGAARNGQSAAVIGYPGGGDEATLPARVVAAIQPEGWDIYSRTDNVRRHIYVLNAKVRKGDSGGPVVDLNGRALGVVFAASTSNDHTGYALTNQELRAALSQAGGASSAVSVGRCAV
jgi:S1-C subfamily serine protease